MATVRSIVQLKLPTLKPALPIAIRLSSTRQVVEVTARTSHPRDTAPTEHHHNAQAPVLATEDNQGLFALLNTLRTEQDFTNVMVFGSQGYRYN